jgi:hypothetical protein
MSSVRKSAANKRNSCKSCGPRTAAGKKVASRNALRHGLSAVIHRQPTPSADIERLALAICGRDANVAVLEQARIVAANELVLHAINAQKIAVVERLRDRTAVALAKGDNSFDLATARFMQAWLAHREIESLVPTVREKYKDQIPRPRENREPPTADQEIGMVPIAIKALLKEDSCSVEAKQNALELARKLVDAQEREDYEALEEGTADLVRLDRYERRVWSRQKRAIRSFMNLKLTLSLNPAANLHRES